MEINCDTNKENVWSLEEMKKEVTIGEQISASDRNKIYEMFKDVQDVFSKKEGEVGKANVQPHVIELTDNTPVWQHPRRFPEPVDMEIERQCEELLSLDIISYSNSRWSSPVVPVRKHDGQLRLCVDYRKVNSVTKAEHFPMPNLLDSIYSAHGMKYFSIVDLVRGYYQVPLDESSKQYTAFSTARNHYNFTE